MFNLKILFFFLPFSFFVSLFFYFLKFLLWSFLVSFFSFHFWATSGAAQVLLLALHSKITAGELRRLYVVMGINLKSATRKASTVPLYTVSHTCN